MVKIKHLLVMLIVAVTSACSGQEEDASLAQPATPETVYVNGRVYTQDKDLPWAQALITHGDKIVFVGSTQDALHYAAGDSKLVDLQGQFVMPGIIDAHTHPGLIGIWADLSGLEAPAGENETPVETDRMPSKPKEATLAWLQQYVDDHPYILIISQAAWDVAAYLPHGPHKRDLDGISRTKPILLYDNSGHSSWVNSAFLRLLGIDRNTPDVSKNLSHFVRDENGEPTGWVKEFALMPYMGASLVPDADELKDRLLQYLNYMSSKGITTLWDAGNFSMDDAVYQAVHDIAREGNLPVRWEGSYHIWAPEQIETATESLHRLRRKYGHGKLQFNTIKIHYDGMQDILTAGMLEPYITDPDNDGGVLFTMQRLSSFLQELDGQGIDLHLHAAGDRATRNILDAVERARAALGRPLRIEVTISHLFSVADPDIKRFRELNVHANFTPHWFGGTTYGDAREINVGPERASRSQVVGHFMQHKVNVSLSSDVVYNPRRVSPFIGIETSITRRAINSADAAILPPLDARISLEQALAGYTINGAAQLGLEGKIGAIKTGMLADFIVLPHNPFETDVERIHRIRPSATIVAGELRSGSLGDRKVPDRPEETSGPTSTTGTVRQNGIPLALADSGGPRQNFQIATPVVAEPVVVAVKGDGSRTGSYTKAHLVPSRLDNPGPGSFQSGLGVISGWACEADEVMIEINGREWLGAYGTERTDTIAVCGDTDNGFGLLFDWNLLGDGEHEVVAYVDGDEFGRATVQVTTLGEEFLQGATGECVVRDFPLAGETTTLEWQQSSQNFVIVAVE